jgi:hypothetical protein
MPEPGLVPVPPPKGDGTAPREVHVETERQLLLDAGCNVSRRLRRPSSSAREARELLRRIGARYGELLDFDPNPDDVDDLDAAFLRAVELADARDERRTRNERKGPSR